MAIIQNTTESNNTVAFVLWHRPANLHHGHMAREGTALTTYLTINYQGGLQALPFQKIYGGGLS